VHIFLCRHLVRRRYLDPDQQPLLILSYLLLGIGLFLFAGSWLMGNNPEERLQTIVIFLSILFLTPGALIWIAVYTQGLSTSQRFFLGHAFLISIPYVLMTTRAAYYYRAGHNDYYHPLTLLHLRYFFFIGFGSLVIFIASTMILYSTNQT